MDSYSGQANDPLSLNLYTYCHNNPVMFVDPSGHNTAVADGFWAGVWEALAQGASKIGIGAYQATKVATPVVVGIWVWNKNSIDAGGDLTPKQLEQISRVENKQEPYIFVLEQPDGTYILTDFEEINEPFSTEGISIIEKENHIYTSPMDRQQTLRVLYALEKGKDSTYTAPTGGGGTTSQVKVGDTNVTFGHGGRHLEGTGLSVDEVNNALANEVVKVHPGTGKFHKGQIDINGKTIEYTSFGVNDGTINIGTYYPVD